MIRIFFVEITMEFHTVGKKAYLVWSVVGTRVVADENATDEEIYNLAHKSLVENLDDLGYELCEDIFEDTEVPYNQEYDDA